MEACGMKNTPRRSSGRNTNSYMSSGMSRGERARQSELSANNALRPARLKPPRQKSSLLRGFEFTEKPQKWYRLLVNALTVAICPELMQDDPFPPIHVVAHRHKMEEASALGSPPPPPPQLQVVFEQPTFYAHGPVTFSPGGPRYQQYNTSPPIWVALETLVNDRASQQMYKQQYTPAPLTYRPKFALTGLASTEIYQNEKMQNMKKSASGKASEESITFQSAGEESLKGINATAEQTTNYRYPKYDGAVSKGPKLTTVNKISVKDQLKTMKHLGASKYKKALTRDQAASTKDRKEEMNDLTDTFNNKLEIKCVQEQTTKEKRQMYSLKNQSKSPASKLSTNQEKNFVKDQFSKLKQQRKLIKNQSPHVKEQVTIGKERSAVRKCFSQLTNNTTESSESTSGTTPGKTPEQVVI